MIQKVAKHERGLGSSYKLFFGVCTFNSFFFTPLFGGVIRGTFLEQNSRDDDKKSTPDHSLLFVNIMVFVVISL